KAMRQLPVKNAIFDGEIVVPDAHGRTSFQRLQNAMGSGRDDLLVYYIFDLLYLEGRDLRGVPLEERKKALRTLLSKAPADGPVRLSQHAEGDGPEVFAKACELGVEGIVSKRKEGLLQARRSKEWLKIKYSARPAE